MLTAAHAWRKARTAVSYELLIHRDHDLMAMGAWQFCEKVPAYVNA